MPEEQSNIRDVRKIELDSFSNRKAMEMGMAIVALAQKRNQNIAVAVARLNHTVFLFIDDNLTPDKHNWLRRKANVARHFEESSLAVKNDLIEKNLSLESTFGLSSSEYIAKGGSIPIFVKGVGIVGTVTVSGLPDTQDHALIVEALSELLSKS